MARGRVVVAASGRPGGADVLRQQLRRSLLTAAVFAVPSVLVLVLIALDLSRAHELATHPRRTTAVVIGTRGAAGTVRFSVGQRSYAAAVDLGRSTPRPGARVPIVYDAEDPSTARLASQPAPSAGAGAAVLGGLAVLVGGGALVATATTLRRSRAVRRVLAEPAEPTPMAYQLTAGHVLLRRPDAGDDGKDDGTAVLEVPLLRRYQGPGGEELLPERRGLAAVHGQVAPGSYVVPVVDGIPLWPRGRATAAGAALA